MKTPRMIAIDMDGTLVHTGGYVTEGNRAALLQAQRCGVRIVIATGRRHSYAMQILSALGLADDTVVLSSNGAVARTFRGGLLFRRSMPLDTARWLCDRLGPFRNCFVMTFDVFRALGEDEPGALVLENLEELHSSIRSWMEINAPSIRRVQPIEDALPADGTGNLPIQAMLCGSMERMAQAEALLSTSHEGRLELFRTEYPHRDLCILDMMPVGCSKGSGLQRLLADSGLTARDLMCLGDNWNDLPTLQLAEWPVLMGNAPESLRAEARLRGWTIGAMHDDDAVADALNACFTFVEACQ